MSGKTIRTRRWWFFANYHGSIAHPGIWGYRYNANHGQPVRSILLLWCELSWGKF